MSRPKCQHEGNKLHPNPLRPGHMHCMWCGKDVRAALSASLAVKTDSAVGRDFRAIDVDTLANIIRFVDGRNTLGAGDLAERILGVLNLAAPVTAQQAPEGEG